MGIFSTSPFVCDDLFEFGAGCGASCEPLNRCLCGSMHVDMVHQHGVWLGSGSNRKLQPIGVSTLFDPNSQTGFGLEVTIISGQAILIPISVKAWDLAACRRPTHPSEDISQCVGVTADEPNHTCYYVVENGAETMFLRCMLDEEAGQDIRIGVTPHNSGRQVRVWSEDCVGASNLACFGKPFFEGTPGETGYATTTWPMWNYLGLDYEDLRLEIDDDIWRHGNHVETALINAALAWLPGDHTGLDTVENLNGADWRLNTWDKWERVFEPATAADCPIVAKLHGQGAMTGSPIDADLVVTYCRVVVRLLLHYNSAAKGVLPTVNIYIDGQLGLRRRWATPDGRAFYTVRDLPQAGHEVGEQVEVLFVGDDPWPWRRRDGFSLSGETMKIASIEGMSFSPEQLAGARVPRSFSWRGFRGATSLGRPEWIEIHSGDLMLQVPTPYCCCLLRNLDRYKVGAYRTNPAGDLDQRWDGNVRIRARQDLLASHCVAYLNEPDFIQRCEVIDHG